jgi:hypothetical protein
VRIGASLGDVLFTNNLEEPKKMEKGTTNNRKHSYIHVLLWKNLKFHVATHEDQKTI